MEAEVTNPAQNKINVVTMDSIGGIIGTLFVPGWLCVCVWSWLKPSPSAPAPQSDDDGERDRQIGFIVGMMGGTVEAAAQVRYSISRLEEDLCRKATMQEIATAVGVKLGSHQ